MDTNTMCNVKNRSASMVVYRIPEKGIRREFAPGETKVLPYSELVDLTYQAGGRSLMENFLQIQIQKVAEDLNLHTDVEYHYSEQDIANLITTGSLDAFLDCLDFAPIGVLDLLKSMAVSIPLTDINKRRALKEKTGFDVDKALAMIEAEKADDEDDSAAAPSGRRVKPAETTANAGRRTTGYKIINKEASAE